MKISLKPLAVLEKKLAKLNDKEKVVLVKRFLNESAETLESVGRELGVTRERVRQIEKSALKKLNKANTSSSAKINEFIIETLDSLGGIASFDKFLEKLKVELNDLGPEDLRALTVFIKAHPKLKNLRQDGNFKAGVFLDSFDLKKGEEILRKITEKVKEKTIPQKLEAFWRNADDELREISEKTLRGLIEISHDLGFNFKDEIGLNVWASIKPKRIRDKVYYTLQREGQPLHFRQIAALIEGSEFGHGRKVFERTVHNELISDDRFVLIGRGIYALKEWGYQRGTVADVIEGVLKEADRPMTTAEIAAAVLQQRDVKKSTIFVNLQNKNKFIKTDKATYALKK